jgi:hypothetical protein
MRASLPRATPLGPPPRSNVVPIMSRLATAERLEAPAPGIFTPAPAPIILAPTTETRAVAAVVADPFGLPATSLVVRDTMAADAPLSIPPERERSRKSAPWMAIAMVAAAAAFGITAAVTIFLRPATPPAQPTVILAPAAPAAPTAAPAAPTESPEPVASSPTPTRTQGAMGGARAAPTPASTTGRSLDLHGLSQGTNIAPGEDPGMGGGGGAGGQCLSQGQLLQTIGQHQVAVRRLCWDRNPTAKPTVGISVSMTVAPDGSTQSVSASGDDIAVAKCIENDIRNNWRFGAIGCSQKVNIPFKFVRQ